MWTLLLWLACPSNEPVGLPQEAVAAKSALVDELKARDPQKVSRAAEHAAQWEGQDAHLDRLLGDALANVLMNPTDGFQLLSSNPDPGDPWWQGAVMAAASRTGDAESMSKAWSLAERPLLSFSHPVVTQISQKMRTDPALGVEVMESALQACMVLDAQPSVGRKALDHPVSADLLDVAGVVGADRLVVGRPIFRTDTDPQTGRGPVQCLKKIWLEDGWPEPFPRALTVGLADGMRKVYIDIRIQDGEPWAFAASDPVAAGRWLEAMKLWKTVGGKELVREKFSEGLWGKPPKEKIP